MSHDVNKARKSAPEVSFGLLSDLLTGLGFHRRDVPDDRVVFTTPESRDHWFAFRPHRDDERVDAAGVAAVRVQLDGWGYLDADEFDDRVRQPSLAG